MLCIIPNSGTEESVTADWNNFKYSKEARFTLQRLVDSHAAMDLHPTYRISLAEEALRGYINSYIAKSTWQKYSSGWNAFCAFEIYYENSFSWPLTKSVWRLFVIWCLSVRKLQPASAKSYIAAIKFVHLIKDVPCFDVLKDPMIKMVLKGAANLNFSSPPRPSTRRVIQLPLLLVIGDRIRRTSWSPLTKQVVWTACTTAFFSSARLGEILASSTYQHDPTSNLMWSDIRFPTEDSILIRLKCAKSGEIQGEFLDLFPFLGFNCCPVASLHALMRMQQEAGTFSKDLPVFRFASGKNLTACQFNSILSSLLSDLCAPGQDTITCHSFRAGIPSTLALFPDLANCDDIKGWGRWHSECYNRYTRLRHDQKRAIFGKIAAALIRDPCPPPPSAPTTTPSSIPA